MRGKTELIEFIKEQDKTDILTITTDLLRRLRMVAQDDYENLIIHEFLNEDWTLEALNRAEDAVNAAQGYLEDDLMEGTYGTL